MDLAMEMAMAVKPIAAETAGKATLQPMERKENRKRRWRREIPAAAWALGDCMNRMERVASQEACELAQLHRAIAKMATMLETHIELQKAPRHGMKLWLEAKEKTWDVYHLDDLLWGEDITDMVERVVAAPERNKKENVGLEAPIHEDLTQTGAPETLEER